MGGRLAEAAFYLQIMSMICMLLNPLCAQHSTPNATILPMVLKFFLPGYHVCGGLFSSWLDECVVVKLFGSSACHSLR